MPDRSEADIRDRVRSLEEEIFPTGVNTPTNFSLGDVDFTPANVTEGGSGTATSVKEYGAVGDGGTDDTAAIEDAIANENRLYFPEGDYITDGLIDWSGVQEVYGDGQNTSSVIVDPNADFGDGDLNAIRATGTSSTPNRGLYVHDLTLDGSRLSVSGSPNAEDNLLHLEYVDNFAIESVELREGGYDAVYLNECRNGSVNGSYVVNAYSSGIHVASNSENIAVTGNRVIQCGDGDLTGGITITGSSDIVTAFNHLNFNNEYGLEVEGTAYDCTSIGDAARSNSNYGFSILGASKLIGPTADSNSGNGIDVFDAQVSIAAPAVGGNAVGISTASGASVDIEGGYVSSNDNEGIVAGTSSTRVRGTTTETNGLNAGEVDLSVDAAGVRVSDVEAPDVGVNGGAASYWDGILGGGPLGGIDLSTVAGNVTGETAVSDGTATNFPAYTLATWDGTNWVRADGQSTATP